MSEYNKTVLTNAGLSLVAKVNKGNTKFTITKAATSAEKLADKSIAELQQLTELPSIMQFGTITDVTDTVQDSNPVIGTELVFNNKDLISSYNINTVGLFAKEEGQDKEILYAVSTAVTPEVMPDYKNKTLFKFAMTMFVVIGKTENVSVNVTENGVVTQVQLDKVIATLVTKTELQEAVKNAGQVRSVNWHAPDKDGNVLLPSFENPDCRYKKGDELDLDTITTPGIYHLMDTTLKCSVNPNALNSVPRNRDNTTFSGFLKIDYHDDFNLTQTLMIYTGFFTPDFTISTRSISIPTKTYRPIFRRLLNIDDYNNLFQKITDVDNKELVHQCDDLATGIAYSKANPNVLVATP